MARKARSRLSLHAKFMLAGAVFGIGGMVIATLLLFRDASGQAPTLADRAVEACDKRILDPGEMRRLGIGGVVQGRGMPVSADGGAYVYEVRALDAATGKADVMLDCSVDWEGRNVRVVRRL